MKADRPHPAGWNSTEFIPGLFLTLSQLLSSLGLDIWGLTHTFLDASGSQQQREFEFFNKYIIPCESFTLKTLFC